MNADTCGSLPIPVVLVVYLQSGRCTCNFYGGTRTLTHMGTVFMGMGRGSGKNTQGLPLSYLNKNSSVRKEGDLIV